MKFYLISDNVDTHMGMRLAGIDGVVVHTPDEVQAAVERAVRDPEIGILLISDKLAALCPGYLNEVKRLHRQPLISEIPDRHGNGDVTGAMEKYIAESIGVRM